MDHGMRCKRKTPFTAMLGFPLINLQLAHPTANRAVSQIEASNMEVLFEVEFVIKCI